MKNILVIGAGRSASSLIKYLLDHSEVENWKIVVGDMDLKLAQQKTEGYSNGIPVAFDINDAGQRESRIKGADIVISMLPAFMHMNVANDCLRLGKHLVTASYVSAEMKALSEEAAKKGLLFLNEIGLDPGIDHMSAMEVIHRLQEQGAKITSFKSYCGGLVAPESNDNPWGYKFTWNPRNVILAGQGTAQFLENGKLKFIPYNRVFSQIDTIDVEGYGKFDAYANRDSLSYQHPYGLNETGTLLRGTLRYEGYCEAWNTFVRLGLTDDTFIINDSDKLTYNDLIESFLPPSPGDLKTRVAGIMNVSSDSALIKRLEWLGIFDNVKITLKKGSPAQLLQHLLEQKWILKPNDLDMIVMQHLFEYELNGAKKKLTSTLVVKGKDQTHTAMAQTVGLPMAIATKLILNRKINLTGVQIPVVPGIYVPVMEELQKLGVNFIEKEF